MSQSLAFIRPAKQSDLPAFYTFALESGPGITSLPRDLHVLEKLLSPQTHSHLFCLELNGQVIGCSSLISRIGKHTPFFAFHKKTEVFHSSSCNIHQEISVLHFIEARKKPTEMGTLFLKKAFRKKGFGSLLSYSRFLFIALFRSLFASTIIVELRGVNKKGSSPFWEAVGRPFFQMDFQTADLLRSKNPSTIKELFPHYPLYSVLLPKKAQDVIGVAHPHTLPAQKLLEKQGFCKSEYIDIFDAGPHLYAHTNEIGLIKQSKKKKVSGLKSSLTSEYTTLIANTKEEFRACYSPFLIDEKGIILPKKVGKILNVDLGEEVIYA